MGVTGIFGGATEGCFRVRLRLGCTERRMIPWMPSAMERPLYEVGAR